MSESLRELGSDAAVIMTDVELAADLQKTVIAIMSGALVHGDSMIHVDRLQRAIEFLRGTRPRAEGVVPKEKMIQLLRNDPFVSTIFQYAYAEAALSGEREDSTENLRMELAQALSDCVKLAKLASAEPEFSNPLAVVDAVNRRDFYLREAARSTPAEKET